MTSGSNEPSGRLLVFISHASKEADLANRFADILNSIGLPAFVYGRFRLGGQNRFDVIRNRITECPYFVLLLTKSARSSQWVNQEIGFAAAKDKVIIPLTVVSPTRGRRLSYFGFAELNDPLDIMVSDPRNAIGELIRTLMEYAKRDGYWKGQIQLSCVCAWRGRRAVRDLNRREWICPRCQRNISVSPVSFEPLPQEPSE